jgi:CHASE2 domain-containing sensor protein
MKNAIIDSFLSTLLIFLMMGTFPFLFKIKMFEPISQSLVDFRVTDISYSKINNTALSLADTNIVIVDIEGLSTIGIAKLVDLINQSNPAVIGIDHIFQKSKNPRLDTILSNVLSKVNNLVLASKLEKCSNDDGECDSIVFSNNIFLENTQTAYLNLLIGLDKSCNTVRSFYPTIKFGNKQTTSFAIAVSEKYNKDIVRNLLNRGKTQEIINYRGGFNKFYFKEAAQILSEPEQSGLFYNKIVLLGEVGAFRGYDLLEELYYTPLNDNPSGRSFPDMANVEIQANIISMIREGNYSSVMPGWLSFLIAIILCYTNMIIFSYICIKNRSWYEIGSLLIFFSESIAILASIVLIFHKYNYEIRLTEALFAIALSVFVYQIYGDSVKPFVIDTYNRLKFRK